jgi:hypothetical protein
MLNLTYGLIDASTRGSIRRNASGIFLSNRFANTPRSSVSLAADYAELRRQLARLARRLLVAFGRVQRCDQHVDPAPGRIRPAGRRADLD